MNHLIPIERIENKIYIIRGKKVMLDRDLAELYSVETKVLNQAVRRNLSRFPDDFILKLSRIELKNLRSQIVTLKYGMQYRPLAFTEQGVAMLSSVLKSERAIMVNIQIIRTFTRLREMLAENAGLRPKIEELEQKYDQQFGQVFMAIKLLLDAEEKPETTIGFTS